MNTISYVVLAMLVRAPLTGYELKRFLNLFGRLIIVKFILP